MASEVRETLRKAELEKAELGERSERQNNKLRETLASAEEEVKTLTTRKHEMVFDVNNFKMYLKICHKGSVNRYKNGLTCAQSASVSAPFSNQGVSYFNGIEKSEALLRCYYEP